MEMKTVMATMFNVRENAEDVKNYIPLDTIVQCEIYAGAIGKPMVRCLINGKEIGRFSISGSVGFTMLPNTIRFDQDVIERMPQNFEAKVVGVGFINPGRMKVAYQVEVEIPADVEVTFAEEEFPYISGPTKIKAGHGVFNSIIELLPQMSSDDLVSLKHRVDKELANR